MSTYGVLQLLGSFVFTGLCLFTFHVAWSGQKKHVISRSLVFSIYLGIGPLLLSYLLALTMRFFPAMEKVVYLVTILGLFSLAFLAGLIINRSRVVANYLSLHAEIYRLSIRLLVASKWTKSLLLALLFLLGLSLAATLLFPLYSNDPLGYFQAAKIVSLNVDFSIYPIIDTEMSSGFYGPWTHPPGYVSLIVWSNFFTESLADPGVGRVISWYFALTTCLVLLSWQRLVGLLASIFLLATPIYFSGVASSHIDAIRVFPILAAFAFFLQAFANHAWRIDVREKTSLTQHLVFIAILGVLFGMAFFVHALSIVCVPLWFAIYALCCWNDGLRKGLIRLTLVPIAMVLFLSVFLYTNYEKLGVIVSDTPEVWQIEKLQHKEHVRQQRKIKTVSEKILNGILKGLSKIRSFGIVYWLFLGSLVCYVSFLFSERRRGLYLKDIVRNHISVHYSLLIVAVYYAMTVCSVLLGSDALIKNDRYLLTIHPFVALFAAWGVNYFFASLIENENS